MRVVLCEDHVLFREGLRAILREQPQIEVVGEAGTGREAVEKVKRLRPDVVLMDIEMPELSGIEATRRIAQAKVRSRVLVLTLYDDEEIVAQCLEAGAAGYVLKDAPSSELLRAVEAVAKGQRYLTPKVLTQMVEHPSKGRGRTRYDLLSGREREVLRLLAEGLTGKEIAARLDLSVKTVDAHKYNLMQKLDLHDRASLVKYALRRKLIRLPVLRPED
ncbi:MAG: response regulator transcription factor [Acidobacteria bacterium]|nr:response regulator transcription factor [Acidobacteriota bacterium]